MSKKNGRSPVWPIDEIRRVSVAQLVPYARNARRHTDEQVEQIVASIKEWGWTNNPILIDEAGVIIAGHGRVLAAQRLGLDEVPAAVASGWSEAQKNAYRIADNKLTENGQWDQSLLRLEVADLAQLGFDLPLLGFSAAELKAFTWPGQEVDDPTGEWDGMPEFEQQDKMPFRTIWVHFENQEAVDEFSRLVEQSFTSKTKFMWFPRATMPHETVNQQYVTDAAT